MAKEKKFLRLEDISAYQASSSLSDKVWEAVASWDWLAKKTIGSQFVDAIDSIAANIAEGFGRFHKRDKQKFCYNARGSVYESAHWCKKAYARKLLTEADYQEIISILRKLPKDINTLIKYYQTKLTI